MLRRIEDITVIPTDDFLDYEGELIFVDTACDFKSHPLMQAFVAIGEAEDELPTLWQDSGLFAPDVFLTYEDNVIHTFLSLDLQSQMEPGKYIFIKVVAIGEPRDSKTIRLA